MRKVEITAYNPNWRKMFIEEDIALRTMLGPEIISIHHIGSTSVCNLHAKPILDILLVVKNIVNIDLFTVAMMKLGYESKGEYGINERRFFQKGGDNRTHHLHFFEKGSPHIMRHLAFRDYLSAHVRAKDAYATLKISLAKQHPYDISAYIKGKESFVTALEASAIEWYKRIHL